MEEGVVRLLTEWAFRCIGELEEVDVEVDEALRVARGLDGEAVEVERAALAADVERDVGERHAVRIARQEEKLKRRVTRLSQRMARLPLL